MAGDSDAIWTEEGPAPRFGALARHLRTSRRLSQGAVAQAAALSPSTVRGWEAGRSEPSMPELLRWSRALDLSEAMAGAVRATLFAPRAWADRPGIGIGPYLRELRLATGTTLSRAAADLGLPLATLGHYESGRVEVPPAVRQPMVERFGVGAVERAALCAGPAAFLEWCDSLVEDPKRAWAAGARATYAVTPAEMRDRGPAFVRLRTGLLRTRLRGDRWAECDAFVTSFHAFWLASGDRRPEAAVALASVLTPSAWAGTKAMGAIVRRVLGRVHAEELKTLAEGERDPARRAWLLSEAALDLCEHRRGGEARALVAASRAEAEELGDEREVWMRRRDAVRVHLRLRDWSTAERELAAMEPLERSLAAGSWYALQREVLAMRIETCEATARSAGA